MGEKPGGEKTGKRRSEALTSTPVKGGWVTRETSTGRFASVQSDKKVYHVSPKTETSVREATAKRSAALKRLADR